MRVAVIGATGHIGTWLVPRLVRAGHEVIAVSRGERDPYHRAPEWKEVRGVRLDREIGERDGTFGHAIASLGADTVVDLICFNGESARHLVGALRDRVGLLVHCGTLWVHGIPKSRPYDETASREPFGEYGIRKAEIERFLLDEAKRGFPATALHPGHITGPGWPPVNPAGNLDLGIFENLASGRTVILPDEGTATLQHVHADDVAQAFELAIANRDAVIGESFHVASEVPVTMRQYAESAARWFGREAELRFLPWNEWASQVTERDAAITRDHVMHSPCASIEKARMVLGFVPRHTAVTAAHEAVRWLVESKRISVQG